MIIERSNGYWLVNESGSVDGPFNTFHEAEARQKELESVKSYKMMVACHNANGEPDFYFCKIRCTKAEYNNGEHYALASRKAKDKGYREPFVTIDENDLAGKAIVDHFVWNAVSEYTV